MFPEAQQKVIDHYEELGFFYDTAYQVERAWAEYNELGCPKDFRAYVAHQSTATSYYNDRAIFYCTNVTLSRNTPATTKNTTMPSMTAKPASRYPLEPVQAR